MIYFSASLVTILAVELLFRLPLSKVLHRLITTNKKILHVVTSRSISDHWKEKVLLSYSGNIALTTLKIASIIGAIALTVVVASTGLDMIRGDKESTLKFLMTWPGISIATLTSVAFSLLRRFYVSR